MLKENNLKLLDNLFMTSYYSYINIKNIKTSSELDSNIRKLYNTALDIFYDGMDTVLEILDMCGVNK